jgi:hypothetical protein
VPTVQPYSRVVDTLPTFQRNSPDERLTFRHLDVAQMTPIELQAMLNARDRYKKALFAEAIAALEKDPTLADVDICKTTEQIASGECLADAVLVASATATAAGRVSVATPSAQAVAGASPSTGSAAAMPGTTPSAGAVPALPAPQATTTGSAPAAGTTVTAKAPATTATPAGAKDQGIDIAVLATLLNPQQKVKAASLPQIQRKFAVLIGIDKYDDRRIPQLDNAVRDAKSVADVLQTQMGYEAIVLENATKQQVVATLNRLATIVNPTDSVIIYYAGHGELVPGTGLGYWQPANADPKDAKTWISNADIGRMITALGASQVALISDSCYSGSLVPEECIRPSTGAIDPAAMLSRKAAVVMSSGGNEPVFDSGKEGHSPFAWNLMRNLQQVSNWQAGGNVFERVRFAVARELPQRPRYGGATASGHQAGSDYLFEQRQLDKEP